MKNLILLIPLLPFLGFLINGLGRKHLSKGLIGAIGSGTVLGSFIISIYAFLNLDIISGGKQISESARVIGNPVLHYFDFINVSIPNLPDSMFIAFFGLLLSLEFIFIIKYIEKEKKKTKKNTSIQYRYYMTSKCVKLYSQVKI